MCLQPFTSRMLGYIIGSLVKTQKYILQAEHTIQMQIELEKTHKIQL